jgi:hypothetical protein
MEVVRLQKLDMPMINQEELVAQWQHTLPIYLNASDRAEVTQDQVNPDWIRVHIDTAGRNLYSFHFCLFYQDSREIRVEFISAEKDHERIVDTETEPVQDLIKDYIRHIHECAQALQKVTHS